MSSTEEEVHRRLQQLQSHFTWELDSSDRQPDERFSHKDGEEEDLDQGEEGAAESKPSSFLAYVRYLQDQPEEALSLLLQSEQQTIECYGEEAERRLIVTYGDLAWLKYLTGDLNESENYLQRVQDILARHPTESPSVLHPEVYAEQAWSLLRFFKPYYPKAMECFHRALELYPDDCELNRGYAFTLYYTEPYVSEPFEDDSPAVKQLRRALELNPHDVALLSLLALKLLYQQNYSESDALVERALELADDDAQINRYVAVYLRKKDQLDESIGLLQKMLEKRSQSAFIHHQLALCYIRKKKNLYLNRSWYRRGEEQYWRSLSIKHLEAAINLKSTLSHAKAALALEYAEEHDIIRAQELFDDVLDKLETEFWSVRQFICRCYAEFCQYHTFQKDLAITYYKKALEFSSSSSEKRHCGKKLKVIAERRLNKNPADAVAYAILGAVAKAQGDLQRAAKNYQEALQRDEDNEEYATALSHLQAMPCCREAATAHKGMYLH